MKRVLFGIVAFFVFLLCIVAYLFSAKHTIN